MVHRVFFALALDFTRIDAEFLEYGIDLRAGAGPANDAWIEAREIILHHRRSVALRIDSDEQRCRLLVGSERTQGFRHLEKRCRADVRAMRIAEENQRRLAGKALFSDGLPV